MKIVLGSDHGGYLVKKELINFLNNNNIETIDVGTYSLDSCNYAEFGIKVGELVANKEADFGIVICNSGEGISIACNKVKGIRCGIGYNDEVAKLLRNHNDANVIAFGAHYQNIDEIKKRVLTFISEPFLGERHQKRVDYIKNFEK